MTAVSAQRMDLAERVLEMVDGRGEAEVRVNGGNLSLTRFANSFIHQNVGDEGDAVSVRLSVGARIASGTTTNTDADALSGFVDGLIESAKLQPIDEDWPGLSEPAVAPDIDHYDPATADASPQERASMVADFVNAGPDMRAAGYCQTLGGEIVFANSNGVRHEGRYTQAIIDGIHQTDTSAGSAHNAGRSLGDLDGGVVGALAAQRAKDSAATYDVKPGEYEVVLSPECVATIGVFLAAYGFNGKSYLEGQSFVDIGAPQFDEKITLIDDVTDPRGMGVGFDAEGTPHGRFPLIEAGITKTVVHDRKTAKKAGTESTGHGGPGSDVYGPFPSLLFLEGGNTSVEAMIADVDRGLYVATFNYCRALEPKTMAVTGLTRNGTFMIEHGEITGAVSGLRFTQSFLSALGPGNVIAVGDDARFADSEFGPGFMHVPSMRLGSWNFTGGADG